MNICVTRRRPVAVRIACAGLGTLLAAFVAACDRAPAPDDGRVIRVAGSSVDFSDVPRLIAARTLVGQGYDVQHVTYGQTELAVEALARGDADVAFGSLVLFWTAALRGAPVVTVMEQSGSRHVLIGAASIASCAALDGRRVGVNSLGATGATLLNEYIAAKCPGTRVEMLVIPGTANRRMAVMNGALEAAVVLRDDAVRVVQEATDRIVVIQDFVDLWPTVATVGMHVNRRFAESSPQAVEDFIRACLDEHRSLGSDAGLLAAEARIALDTDENLLPVAEAFIRARAWDPMGGLTEPGIAATLRFLTATGGLDPSADPDALIDRSFLDRVLERMEPGASRRGSRP